MTVCVPTGSLIPLKTALPPASFTVPLVWPSILNTTVPTGIRLPTLSLATVTEKDTALVFVVGLAEELTETAVTSEVIVSLSERDVLVTKLPVGTYTTSIVSVPTARLLVVMVAVPLEPSGTALPKSAPLTCNWTDPVGVGPPGELLLVTVTPNDTFRPKAAELSEGATAVLVE